MFFQNRIYLNLFFSYLSIETSMCLKVKEGEILPLPTNNYFFGLGGLLSLPLPLGFPVVLGPPPLPFDIKIGFKV